MFQRRHYIALAQQVATLNLEARRLDDVFLVSLLESFAERIADTLSADNARFNRTRFLVACGYDVTATKGE